MVAFTLNRVFREEGNSLLFTGNKMQVFIPEYYFEKKIANIVGEKINTLALFNFKIMNLEDFNTGELHQFLLPTNITFGYTSTVKGTYKLAPDVPEEQYRVFELYNNDIIIENLSIIENAGDTKNFIDLLHAGKLPTNISYDEIISIYHNSLDINKVSLGVPSVILELIIAELCRNKTNLNQSFRLKAKKGDKGYKFVSLKSLPEINSTFTSISFENINQSIISSINHTRNDDEESVSPLEKTIKY